jgi:hypothetical protein
MKTYIVQRNEWIKFQNLGKAIAYETKKKYPNVGFLIYEVMRYFALIAA